MLIRCGYETKIMSSDNTSNNLSDEDILREQVRQVREVLIAMESEQKGGISPEEIWSFMKQKMENTTPIHSRIRHMVNSYSETENVRRALKRLENDLHDAEQINEPQDLYDPMKNEIEDQEDELGEVESEDEGEDDSKDSTELQRDKEQRPLSAYE